MEKTNIYFFDYLVNAKVSVRVDGLQKEAARVVACEKLADILCIGLMNHDNIETSDCSIIDVETEEEYSI